MILQDVRSTFGRDEAAQLVQLLARHGEDSGLLESLLAEQGIDVLLDHPKMASAVIGGDGV